MGETEFCVTDTFDDGADREWNEFAGAGRCPGSCSEFRGGCRRDRASENRPSDVRRAASVARGARITDTDAQGQIVVLRQGNNGFTCIPRNPKVVADPSMCVDAPALQWYADAKAYKPKLTNAAPGITYMLAGATQRSDSGPHDTTSTPIEIGPRWMIMWPFDPKTTGLPTKHKATGAYIMWAGSPYAHLHIMGRP